MKINCKCGKVVHALPSKRRIVQTESWEKFIDEMDEGILRSFDSEKEAIAFVMRLLSNLNTRELWECSCGRLYFFRDKGELLCYQLENIMR